MKSGYPSEGLPYLRKAFILDKVDPQIALKLSETLFDLGHFEEANQVLVEARKVNPQEQPLAFLHGQVNLALGDKKAAMLALLNGIPTHMTDPNPAILLAQTCKSLLDEENAWDDPMDTGSASGNYANVEQIGKIVDALKRAVEIDPHNAEAQILLGELSYVSGSFQDAFNIFSKIIEDNKIADLDWLSRLRTGLGKAAIKLGQIEFAITSLREAASANADNVAIQKALTDALIAADLKKEALQTAKSILQITPDELDDTIWFAHKALALGADQEARDALNHAMQLAPDNATVMLWLAKVYLESGDKDTARTLLVQIAALQEASIGNYRKAANYLTQIDEINDAITCLEKAVQKDLHPSWDLYVDLAMVYKQAGRNASALSAIENAALLNPENAEICVLHADLLATLGNDIASLDCLNHAMEIVRGEQDNRKSEQVLEKAGSKTPDLTKWVTVSVNEILTRIAKLLQYTGQFFQALATSKEAVQIEPEDIQARRLAVELAFGLMQDEEALALCQSSDYLEKFTKSGSPASSPKSDETVSLLALFAELLLEQNQTEKAGGVISEGMKLAPDHPHLSAVQSELFVKTGDTDEAIRSIETAVSQYHVNKVAEEKTSSFESNKTANQQSIWTMLAIADAALALEQWQTANSFYQLAIQTEPRLPRPHLKMARALVIMAENQDICQELNITAHAPGTELLGDSSFHQFESEITSASRFSASPEVGYWDHRGQAFFEPSVNSIHNLRQDLTKLDDMTALVGVFRRMANPQGAKEAAESGLENPHTLFQLALALRSSDPDISAEISRKLVAVDANNPHFNALLAQSIRNDPLEARQFIEKALESWPDEIEWHKLAARLCAQAGDHFSAVSHWQQVVDLNPSDASHNVALGKSYLECGEYEDARLSFEQASRQDPDLVSTWKLLGQTYLESGDIEKAVQSIDYALSLDPDDREASILDSRIKLANGQHEEVVQKIQTEMEEFPNDAETALIYAQALKQSEKYAEALNVLDQVLPMVGDPYPLQLERARILKQTQGNEVLLPSLLELTNAHPDRPEVLALLAKTFSELGQLDAAEKTAQAALRLAPDQPDMHLLLGHIDRAKGQLDQSVYHLDVAIRRIPSQVDAYLELGLAYQDRREHHQALKTYRQASQIAPEDFRPYYQAGLVLRESKDYIKAKSMFRRAARLAPTDVNVKRQLGAVITLNLVHNPQEAMISHEY